MVENLQMGEPITKSRLEKWALALREAFFNRSPYRGHRRCLDAQDMLTRIEKRITHEKRFRHRMGSRPRPWEIGADISEISNALAAAIPEESSLGKLLRVHIYDKVEAGELTPQKVEYWAKVFQWSPFAAWADETLFDPDEARLWSLGMAIKWVECVQLGLLHDDFSEPLNDIDWLDDALRKVRQEWPEYIERSLRWVKNREGGHSLAPKLFKGHRRVDPDAKQLLTNAMRNRKIQAVGINAGVETRISPEAWARLRIVGRKDLDGADRVVDAITKRAQAGEVHAQVYDSVYVNQRSVRLAFPAPSVRAEPQKYVGATKLKSFLKEESARQGGKRIPERAAHKLLASSGQTARRETLRQVISELWGAPRGRPRKSAG